MCHKCYLNAKEKPKRAIRIKNLVGGDIFTEINGHIKFMVVVDKEFPQKRMIVRLFDGAICARGRFATNDKVHRVDKKSMYW